MTDVGTRAPDADRRHAEARVGNPNNMNMYQQGVTITRASTSWLGAALRHRHRQGRADPRPRRGDARGARRQLHQVPRAASAGPDLVGRPAFTADDVVYTAEMIRDTKDFAYSAAFTNAIASVTKVDDHTVEITTTRPTPRLSIVLGSVIYGNPSRSCPSTSGRRRIRHLHQLPAGDDQRLQVQGRRPQRHLVPLGEARRLAEHRHRPDRRRAQAQIRALPLLRHRGARGARRWRRTTWTS